MSSYDVEVGENRNASLCRCCGNDSYVGHGFIYKDGNAYAVYYVGWSEEHFDKRVSIALAIGEWDDNSTAEDRTCFGVEVSEGKDEFLFRIMEPGEAPWSNTGLLGLMLSRDEALSHPLLKEVFFIVENILRDHVALHEYLMASGERI
ncbi:hypothetical protein [Phytopseudomonas dryadis]|uniref:hypothetical protein n=1 Tax=Pseudomonadaceae TaxID=135621 RepID=UPI001038174C|nr:MULTISPECIES: hypothetical protein [Pseudomonas]